MATPSPRKTFVPEPTTAPAAAGKKQPKKPDPKAGGKKKEKSDSIGRDGKAKKSWKLFSRGSKDK